MSRFKIKNIVDRVIEKLIIALVTLVICLVFIGVILVITGSTTVSMISGGFMFYITLAVNVIS